MSGFVIDYFIVFNSTCSFVVDHVGSGKFGCRNAILAFVYTLAVIYDIPESGRRILQPHDPFL